MEALGIDLSSSAKNTAACRLRILDGRAEIAYVHTGCTDDVLAGYMISADAIGIDAPLGWPMPFRAAVAQWSHLAWTTELRDTLRFRLTDTVVAKRLGRWPLSVSSDRIALPAMRAMALLAREGVVDKSGNGRFFEVYPAASLRVWGLPHRGYKNADASESRKQIAAGLAAQLMLESLPLQCLESDHSLDALVCAITAALAKGGRTEPPDVKQLLRAAHEGWIHVPRDTRIDLNSPSRESSPEPLAEASESRSNKSAVTAEIRRHSLNVAALRLLPSDWHVSSDELPILTLMFWGLVEARVPTKNYPLHLDPDTLENYVLKLRRCDPSKVMEFLRLTSDEVILDEHALDSIEDPETAAALLLEVLHDVLAEET